jgi:hypothetical protein
MPCGGAVVGDFLATLVPWPGLQPRADGVLDLAQRGLKRSMDDLACNLTPIAS